MQRVPVTKAGHIKMQEELTRLKKVERPRIIEAIRVARELGDLKENAEYQEAKREQSLVEGRIQELEAKLSNCQVIDIATLPKTGKVVFGVTVTLVTGNSEASLVYQIVGEDEADVKNNKIFVGSPLARALIGKEEGDEVQVQTPNGIVSYEIVEVIYE